MLCRWFLGFVLLVSAWLQTYYSSYKYSKKMSVSVFVIVGEDGGGIRHGEVNMSIEDGGPFI